MKKLVKGSYLTKLFVPLIFEILTVVTYKKVEPLIDNVPLAEYFYQITVYTGTKANSGTTSDVGFRLSGVQGRTEAHIFKTRTDVQNHKSRKFLPFTNPKRGFTRGSVSSGFKIILRRLERKTFHE